MSRNGIGQVSFLIGQTMKLGTSTFGLLCINVAYLYLGAWFFLVIEQPRESTLQNNLEGERNSLVDQIMVLGMGPEHAYRGNASEKLASYELSLANFYRKRATFKQSSGNESVSDLKLWTWAGSIIYCYSVVTSIGWGNIVPATINGRLGTVIYGLNGMPLFFTLSSEVGNSFSRIIITSWAAFRNYVLPSVTLKNLYRKKKSRRSRKKKARHKRKLSSPEVSENTDYYKRDDDKTGKNRSGNQCSIYLSGFSRHVNTSYFPRQCQQKPLDRSRSKQVFDNSSASLASPRSCIDFLLYAHNEICHGRTPEETAHFRIKTKQDALLLCRYFHGMTNAELIKCMEYVGFDLQKKYVSLMSLDTTRKVISSRSQTCEVPKTNLEKVLISNQLSRGTIAPCTVGVHKNFPCHETIPKVCSLQLAMAQSRCPQRDATILHGTPAIAATSQNRKEFIKVCSGGIDKEICKSTARRIENINHPEGSKLTIYGSLIRNSSYDRIYKCKYAVPADGQPNQNVKEYGTPDERFTGGDLCDTNRGRSTNLILQVPRLGVSNNAKWRSDSPDSHVPRTETSLKLKFSDSRRSETGRDAQVIKQSNCKCLNDKNSTDTNGEDLSETSTENVVSMLRQMNTVKTRNEGKTVDVMVSRSNMMEPSKGTVNYPHFDILAEKTGDNRPLEMQMRNVHISRTPAHITDTDCVSTCCINTTSLKHTDNYTQSLRYVHVNTQPQHIIVQTAPAKEFHPTHNDVAKSAIQDYEVKGEDQGKHNGEDLPRNSKPRMSEVCYQVAFDEIEKGVQEYQGASLYDPKPTACQFRPESVHYHRRTACQSLLKEETTCRPMLAIIYISTITTGQSKSAYSLPGYPDLTIERSSPRSGDNYSDFNAKPYLPDKGMNEMSMVLENENAKKLHIQPPGVDSKQATNVYSIAELASSMKSKIQPTAAKVNRFLLRKALTVATKDPNQCLKLHSWKRKDESAITAKELFLSTAVEARHGGKPSFQICPEICKAENIDTFVSVIDGFCVRDSCGHFSVSETEMTPASSQFSVGITSSATNPHDKTRSGREKHRNKETHPVEKTQNVDRFQDLETYLFSSKKLVKSDHVVIQADVTSVDKEQYHKHLACFQKCCSQKALGSTKHSFLEAPCNTKHSIQDPLYTTDQSNQETLRNPLQYFVSHVNEKITTGTPTDNKMPTLSRSDESGKYLTTGECSGLVENARSNYNTNSGIYEYKDGYYCTAFSKRRYPGPDEEEDEFISGRGFGFNPSEIEKEMRAVIVPESVEEQVQFTLGSMNYIYRPDKKMLERFHMPLYIVYAIVMLYVLLGSLVFFTWQGDLGFWDSLYFIYVMLSTTGFGDLLPSPKMYSFVVVYGVIGMALYNIMINVTLELFLEVFEYLSAIGQPKQKNENQP